MKRLLLVPAAVAPGPYRSLERVFASTAAALAEHYQVARLAPVNAGRDAFDADVARRARGAVAVFDLSLTFATARAAPALPILTWPLGSLPHGGLPFWLHRRHVRPGDTLLVNSTADRAIAGRLFAGGGPRLELQPFGVDTDCFRPLEPDEREAARRELGVGPGQVLVAYAGRLNRQKNLHGLARAVARARAGGAGRPLLLILAGTFDDVPLAEFRVGNEGYDEYLRQLVEGLGLGDEVRFPGALGDADLARLLGAADLVANLSLHQNENFGYAAVEAMACATPVVASDWGGLRDTVVPGETGLAVPTWMTEHGPRASVAGAAAAIARLAGDPELRHRLGRAGRARAEERFGLGAFARGLRQRVEEAVAAATAPADAAAAPGDPPAGPRFHPLAMRHYLRQTYLLARPGALTGDPGRLMEQDDPEVYRFFLEPYASGDATRLELADDDRLDWLTDVRLAGDELRSDDPIWPRRYRLEPGDRDALAGVDGGLRVADLARGSPPRRELLARLVREGVAEVVPG
jgi:glycosyltransferase involved in cell wall biosynthesis